MAELLTLARPYAKAVFEYASESNALEQWSNALRLLAIEAVIPEVVSLRDNPKLSNEDLVAMHVEPFAKQLSQEQINFVKLLTNNNRLNLLPEIHFLFEQHKAAALKQIDIELISATTLNTQQQEMFTTALKKKFGKEIKLTCREDSSLVGGAIIRAGDQVIDGSVKGRLAQMSEALAS